MGFFNSLSIRITLALIGGILYSLLAYNIIILLDLSSEFAIFTMVFIFLFYLGSRLLILFSRIDSPYYSKRRGSISYQLYEKTSFYQTAQWVGKFYHYHDIVLFAFLSLTAIVFLISLVMDWSGNKPLGETIQNLWNAFIVLPWFHILFFIGSKK
jgi:hypothetical protein